ncbi:hypothetical protein D3C80_1536340 [compost metagenome]
MEAQELEQFVVGEGEAHLMRTHHGAKVTFNVLSAVDGEHGLTLHRRCSTATPSPTNDQYQWPAGQWLPPKRVTGTQRIYVVRSDCPLKPQCANAQRQHVTRHDHEAAFARMQPQPQPEPEPEPEIMVRRRSIVEHPFGNLKPRIRGNGRFLLRQLQGARREVALALDAYKLKRALNLLGARRLIELLG